MKRKVRRADQRSRGSRGAGTLPSQARGRNRSRGSNSSRDNRSRPSLGRGRGGSSRGREGRVCTSHSGDTDQVNITSYRNMVSSVPASTTTKIATQPTHVTPETRSRDDKTDGTLANAESTRQKCRLTRTNSKTGPYSGSTPRVILYVIRVQTVSQFSERKPPRSSGSANPFMHSKSGGNSDSVRVAQLCQASLAVQAKRRPQSARTAQCAYYGPAGHNKAAQRRRINSPPRRRTRRSSFLLSPAPGQPASQGRASRPLRACR